MTVADDLHRWASLLCAGLASLLSQPGLQCADLVFDEMQRIAAQCEGTELTRFPCLRDRIVEVSKS